MRALCALVAWAYAGRDDDVTLLQHKGSPPGAPQTEGDMAEVTQAMLRVRSECRNSTAQCLPALVEARHQIWPHVLAEIGPEFGEYPPHGFTSDFARANLNATGCAGKSLAFLHVWKAAGWGIIYNFQKITSNFYWGTDFEHGCADWGSPSTFTFVREPLRRFISGYAQLEPLAGKWGCRRLSIVVVEFKGSSGCAPGGRLI